MSKGRMASARIARLEATFDAGDHGAARRLASEIEADAAATAAEHEAAASLLARIAPDRAVVIAGLAGAAGAVAVTAWLLLR